MPGSQLRGRWYRNQQAQAGYPWARSWRPASSLGSDQWPDPESRVSQVTEEGSAASGVACRPHQSPSSRARSAVIGYPAAHRANPQHGKRQPKIAASRQPAVVFPARPLPPFLPVGGRPPSPSRARDVLVGRSLLSQKRARLRALASCGLSIVLFGALVPATSAASIEASPLAGLAATSALPATSALAVISAPSLTGAPGVNADAAALIGLSAQD